MRWIHKTCRKQMRWREKFFWWKIYENELGDNIPYTLCIPQPQPFYNFFPYPEVISQLALRITTYEYPLGAILAIYFLSVTGHMPDKFPTDQWIEAVRWHGDTKIAADIHTAAEWEDAKTLLARLENVVVEAESKQGAVVWSSAQNNPPAIPTDSFPLQLIVLTGNEIQRHLPETLQVEATGLGGRDLSYPIPWDISIRSDKEGQSVYGPRATVALFFWTMLRSS